MGQKLAGKIALVTGGTSGLGLATAKRFVAEGATVVVTGRRQAELDAAVRELGGSTLGVRGDVASLADLDRLYAAIRAAFGRLDIVFANAGGGAFVPLGEVTEAHFDKYFGTNVKGTLFTVQKALPLMAAGGSVVLTGSMVSLKGMPGFTVYAATKAALRSFARDVGGGPAGEEHPRQRGQPRHGRHAGLQDRVGDDRRADRGVRGPGRLAPTQSESPFAVAQGVTLLAFVALGVVANSRFRPAA